MVAALAAQQTRGPVNRKRVQRLMTLDETGAAIGAYIDNYHHRPQQSLAYRTPREVAATWQDHRDQSIPAA
jgi:hypothetical protein